MYPKTCKIRTGKLWPCSMQGGHRPVLGNEKKWWLTIATHWNWVLDMYWSPMDLQQSLSHIASSLLYLLHLQVHSISITSLTPLHSSLFLLFHPSSLHPCFIDICPHVTMILLSFTYSLLTPFLFFLFHTSTLSLVPDQVKPTLQHRTS